MTVAASTSAYSVSTREGYAQWAATYNEDVNPVLQLQERMLRAILPDARAKTVVDLGCGTGQILSLWREQNAARLIGLDLSPQMVRRAAGTADALIVADCCALPLANRTADLISCCLTLGYLADLDLFVSEVARVLKPTGTVLISELHPESVVRFNWRRGFTRRGQPVYIDASAFPIREVVAAFEQRGLEADLLLEVPFGIAELSAFEAAGRREQFERFQGHPAIYMLGLRRSDMTGASRESFSLNGARVVLNATEAATAKVSVAARQIHSIRVTGETTAVDLSGFMLFPGLINAHDHLEFALFPRLGHGHYRNSREWAKDIYRPDESPIREHLRVPKWVRLWWGAVRNLLCGVTTVCHHNPYEEDVFGDDFPVRVVRDMAWAHSLAFDPSITRRFREAAPEIPFVVHAGEGVDRASSEEIRTLSKLGVLDARTVIVHGTGLDNHGRALLNDCGAALVWCPSSNTFLFNRTIAPDQVASLKSKAIGSDSPLTAAGDLLDEIRFAHSLGTPAEMLFRLVTMQPNRMLRLKHQEGQIRPGAVADLVVVRDRRLPPSATLSSISYRDVEMVMLGGQVRLVSDDLKSSLPEIVTATLELLVVDGVRRWLRAPVGSMLQLSREALGSEITMCGRSLTQ